MNLPMDFQFDYEQPNKKGLRTPISVYLNPHKRSIEVKPTGGLISISKKWMDKNKLSMISIAVQVKDKNNTFIIFNPPVNAPQFRGRIPKRAHRCTFSCTGAVRKILNIFNPGTATKHELWLDFVGNFAENSVVYRLRNIKETDTLYNF